MKDAPVTFDDPIDNLTVAPRPRSAMHDDPNTSQSLLTIV
jgi:hypothetical protein